jgi:hypothetical protein
MVPVTSDVSEEHMSSIFWVRSRDIAHDGQGRDPLAAAPLQSCLYVTVELLLMTINGMKNGVFWDVTPCGSCKNQGFGGT